MENLRKRGVIQRRIYKSEIQVSDWRWIWWKQVHGVHEQCTATFSVAHYSTSFVRARFVSDWRMEILTLRLCVCLPPHSVFFFLFAFVSHGVAKGKVSDASIGNTWIKCKTLEVFNLTLFK